MTLFAIAVILVGCTEPAGIVDLEEDKVVVKVPTGTDANVVKSMARKGCAIHGRAPVLVSEICDEYLDPYC